MATLYPLPDGPKIKTILGLLFDDIDVKAGGKVDTSPASGTYVGVYISDSGAPVALCACDSNLSANWSAALSMLPVGIAKDAARNKALTDVMVGNLREIMNICTRLVMSDSSPHLRLDDVYPVQSLPAPAAALVGQAKGRSDFQVAVPKYGGGVLALMSS